MSGANFLDELAKFEQEISSLSKEKGGGEGGGGGGGGASKPPPPPPPPPLPGSIAHSSRVTTASKGKETTVVKTVKNVKPVVSYASAPVPAEKAEYQDAALLAKAALSRVNSTLAAVGGLSNVVSSTVPPPPEPPPLSSAPWHSKPPPPPPPSSSSRAAESKSSSSQKGKKKEKKGNKFMRTAAGEVWEDKTLAEWPENDFRLFCGDLGNEVNDTVLAKAFAKYSSFAKAKVVRNKRTQKSKVGR